MKSQECPLVSAIMLAGQSTVKEITLGIDCFTKQSYPYKELVIVNNAKNQYEASKLNIYARKDVFIIDTPVGLTAGMARNYGISAANGQILAQFDSNFYYHPKRLEYQIKSLEGSNKVSFLARTLQYSLISGIARYNDNDAGFILNTMVLSRPRDVDYPNINKGEEKAFLDRLIAINYKEVILDKPELACKIINTKHAKKSIPELYDVNSKDMKTITRILSQY